LATNDIIGAWNTEAGCAGEKLVLVYLASKVDRNRRCQESQADISKATQQCERTVRAHLAALERSGLIVRYEGYSLIGARSPDVIELTYLVRSGKR
jgi:DNA-binding MarR family transcriptional regulator